MMHPLCVLKDGTTVLTSEVCRDVWGEEYVRVRLENSKSEPYKYGECFLPGIYWQEIVGFTEIETMFIRQTVMNLASDIIHCAREEKWEIEKDSKYKAKVLWNGKPRHINRIDVKRSALETLPACAEPIAAYEIDLTHEEVFSAPEDLEGEVASTCTRRSEEDLPVTTKGADWSKWAEDEGIEERQEEYVDDYECIRDFAEDLEKEDLQEKLDPDGKQLQQNQKPNASSLEEAEEYENR